MKSDVQVGSAGEQVVAEAGGGYKIPVSEKDLLNPEMKTIMWGRSLLGKRALWLGAFICIQTMMLIAQHSNLLVRAASGSFLLGNPH